MRALIMIWLTLGLTYAYLYPGSQALLESRNDLVMSDGTDITGMPYVWDAIRHEWEAHPSRLLYGSIFSEISDPTRGFPMWASWIERLIGIPLTYVVPIEQLSTALVVALMCLNVIAMYALGRYRKWNPWIAFSLSVAWGFSYYARARGQVHPAFSGVYHIPLIFLGLSIIARDTRRRAVAITAGLFLFAAMAPHYYVITAAALTPFYFIFVYLESKNKMSLARLTLAALPAIFFLAANLKFSLPREGREAGAKAIPETGATPDGSLHPFLNVFGARPIDYITGNLALSLGPNDPNPLKRMANASVFNQMMENPREGNAHERTNGVRWIVWGLALAAIFSLRKNPRDQDTWFFVALALGALALSFPPAYLGYGPSAWLYRLVPQVRVPARAGMWVGFALIMLAGKWLSTGARWRFWPLLLPILIVLEDPPFYQSVRMAAVEPAFAPLAREHGNCGIGMYFPFVNNEVAQIPYYRFLSRLRGTNCQFLNGLADVRPLHSLTALFPPAEEYIRRLDQDLVTSANLAKLVRCVPLRFVAFDPIVPYQTAANICRSLNWQLDREGLCMSPTPPLTPVSATLANIPPTCI